MTRSRPVIQVSTQSKVWLPFQPYFGPAKHEFVLVLAKIVERQAKSLQQKEEEQVSKVIAVAKSLVLVSLLVKSN